jgi:HAD superfamily hydrolase (TIGR01549 family)
VPTLLLDMITKKRNVNNLNTQLANSINHFCFDLDGTLVDSNKTIYEATSATLKTLNIKFDVDEKDYVHLIGKHFVDIFKALNISIPDFDLFINIYKKKYFDFMIYSSLYNGVETTLAELKNRGIKISLLTTKLQEQADKIIEHFNLSKYFDLVMGRREGIAHKPAAEPLLIICKELNIDVKSTLMIGDTELDIQCGKNAGANTCAVLYGYRKKELLEIEQPDFMVSEINELMDI